MALMNLDAGEHPDEPEELWALFDVLNIACGGHAGDAASMEHVVRWCVASGRAIGAHPSYPDRPGFGRRTMAIEPAALAATVAEQCAALAAIARRHARTVEYVKPHGALYHDAAASEPMPLTEDEERSGVRFEGGALDVATPPGASAKVILGSTARLDAEGSSRLSLDGSALCVALERGAIALANIRIGR
jgi:UPF0271 protein